jgi:prepilin-type N-terminal cleavage/methylation domain-containing protein
MKLASIGSPAGLRSRPDSGKRQAGFTLLEALVAMALVLTFAAALGPYLSQARRIMDHAAGRVAAQVLLRSLLEAPFDRSSLAQTSRKGEENGLRWSIAARPADVISPRASDQKTWVAYRLTATVIWADDQAIAAETIRLGRPEP